MAFSSRPEARGPGSLMSREARFLLLASADQPDAEGLRQLLDEGLDWPRLTRLAVVEKAVPVLWRVLVATGDRKIIGAVPESFRRLATVAEFKAVHLQRRLEDAIQLLWNERVEVTLLKGAALARTVYRSEFDRPMGDVDILVPAEHALRAQALLQRAGWVPKETDSGEEFYAGHHHLPPLVDGAGTGMGLEVHTALFAPDSPVDLPVADVIADSQPIEIGGAEVRVPSARHMMLHACLHYAWSHGFGHGSWRALRDIDAVRRHAVLDPADFMRLADRSRGATSCYWTLRIAHASGVADIPTQLIDPLRPEGSEVLFRGLERYFLSYLFPQEARPPSVWVTQRAWELAIQPEASGHGSHRPWDAQARVRPDSAVPVSVKVRQQLRRAREWGRFAKRILIDSPSS